MILIYLYIFYKTVIFESSMKLCVTYVVHVARLKQQRYLTLEKGNVTINMQSILAAVSDYSRYADMTVARRSVFSANI